MRSVRHQMHAAKFPVHSTATWPALTMRSRRWTASWCTNWPICVSRKAHTTPFWWAGRAPGTTHLATAIGVSGTTRHGMRVRFHSTVDLVNLLEQEKAQGKAGRIAASLLRMDWVILDGLGYLPFSRAGGALLCHLLSKLTSMPAC